MEVIGWNEKSFEMLHTFIYDDRVVAEGTSPGCLISRSGDVPSKEFMKKATARFQKQCT